MKFKLILATTVALFVSVSGIAQPASLPQLASKDALRIWLVRQVREGTVYVYSPTMVGDTMSKGLSWKGEADPATLSKDIDAASKTSIVVGNPDDWVSVSVSLRSADGYEIFSGGGSAQATLVDGKRTLPTVQSTLWPSWQIPVAVGKNVVSASMAVTWPFGGQTTQTLDLQVQGGNVLFRSDLAGQGLLTLIMLDGTKVTYNLRDASGKTVKEETYAVVSQSAFQGLLTVTDPTEIDRMISVYQGQGESETYAVTMTAAKSVKISVTTSEGGYPVGYVVVAGGTETFVAASEKSPSATVSLPAGVSYVYTVWLPEDLRPYDNGGKG